MGGTTARRVGGCAAVSAFTTEAGAARGDLPLLLIGGPTASGKSALAVDVAERFGGVVVNADSMQVYRNLPILTAWPDAGLRARIETEPRAVLSERGIELPVSVETRIVADTDDVFHMIMPPDPNMDLGDEALHGVAAGTQTASSGGTVGTFGCLPSCIGSASSLGTAGSLGPNS